MEPNIETTTLNEQLDLQTCEADSTQETIDNNKSNSNQVKVTSSNEIPSEESEEDESEEETHQKPKQSNSTIAPYTSTTPATYDPKNVHYEGDVAIYTDPASNYQYTWNKVKEEWEPKSNVSYGFEDDTHTYTDSDGTKFFWDKDKNAWFPKINDDFMAQYQMSYGFVDNTQPSTTVPETPKPELPQKIDKKAKKGEKRKASEPTWFELDEKLNTKVYVSNLPLDITEEEFVTLMQKYGIIMRDPITQKLKIKLYTEPNTNFLKGDALCTYIRVESVDLAIKLLHGTKYRDKEICVERAKFNMKGTYDPKLKPKSKKKKEKQKLAKMQEKLFDWRPEKMRGERSKHEKIVIVKNVFESSEFDEDAGLILEYQQDLREECSKCGEVRKVIIYDRHPEGVAQVNMKIPEEADAVVQLLNGRWFGKRKLSAEIWNGKTKFKIAETDSQISQRLNNWDKFLQDEDGGNSKGVKDKAVNDNEIEPKTESSRSEDIAQTSKEQSRSEEIPSDEEIECENKDEGS